MLTFAPLIASTSDSMPLREYNQVCGGGGDEGGGSYFQYWPDFSS